MQNIWMQLWSLAAGVAGLIVFVWAGPFSPMLGFRRWLAGSTFLLVFGVTAWSAFGTTSGYFWLNRTRLEALVAAIEAVPAISSLELGNDDPLPRATRRSGRYNSYRFINGEIDVLRDLGVSFVPV